MVSNKKVKHFLELWLSCCTTTSPWLQVWPIDSHKFSRMYFWEIQIYWSRSQVACILVRILGEVRTVRPSCKNSPLIPCYLLQFTVQRAKCPHTTHPLSNVWGRGDYEAFNSWWEPHLRKVTHIFIFKGWGGVVI